MQFTTLSLLATLAALGLAQDNVWEIDTYDNQCDEDKKCAYLFKFSSKGSKDTPDFAAQCEGHTGYSDTTLRPCSIIPGVSGDNVKGASAYYAQLPPSKWNDQGKSELKVTLDFDDQHWEAEHHGPYDEYDHGDYFDVTPERA
ncbi:unnamed protein product [Zymoseptoria tritici ST99CH_3D1]|uniref:Uncharacterized protein n=2 Tax=Zymoseptoria tritici TaxID=1047171 RepID=A0A1X7S7E0_ZYMT9|nr:unnamed protein product [Zymoseptoria tritici ST99CH_3D7]SMR60347.1 unnamed protein product [Zymoseptoria tritici ST99CH_1E4]SMR63460.1 unnamed protein product [Zymoseptoria tritici ST99CH_3D1]